MLTVEFELPGVDGLKGRRKTLNSLKESLKRMNLSVIDTSGEYPGEASLEVALVAHTDGMAVERSREIERFLASRFPEYEFNVSMEIL